MTRRQIRTHAQYIEDKTQQTQQMLQEAQDLLAMMQEDPEGMRTTFGMPPSEFEEYRNVLENEIETHKRTLRDIA